MASLVVMQWEESIHSDATGVLKNKCILSTDLRLTYSRRGKLLVSQYGRGGRGNNCEPEYNVLDTHTHIHTRHPAHISS